MCTSRPFHLPALTPTLGHPWLGTPHHTVSWGLVGSPSAPAPLVSMGRYMRRPLSHRPPPGLPPCPQPQPAMSLALGEWAQESAPRPAVPSRRSASCPPHGFAQYQGLRRTVLSAETPTARQGRAQRVCSVAGAWLHRRRGLAPSPASCLLPPHSEPLGRFWGPRAEQGAEGTEGLCP